MGTKWISQNKKYTGMFLLGRPWGYGKKIAVGAEEDKVTEGFWDMNKFISQRPS
jgi:hypothetical protein